MHFGLFIYLYLQVFLYGGNVVFLFVFFWTLRSLKKPNKTPCFVDKQINQVAKLATLIQVYSRTKSSLNPSSKSVIIKKRILFMLILLRSVDWDSTNISQAKDIG